MKAGKDNFSREWQRTALYSALHFLVDGICAAAMAMRFARSENGYFLILVYNFCAFVLQMPFGVMLDLLLENVKMPLRDAHLGQKEHFPGRCAQSRRDICFLFAASGAVLTILGAFTTPWILGIGNALFHIGGGVSTIEEDRLFSGKGVRLGIFVAPGAMGLFLGKQAAKNALASMLWLPACALLAAVLFFLLWRSVRTAERNANQTSEMESAGAKAGPAGLILFLCTTVVILRSWTGMSVGMTWNDTFWTGVFATAAVVLGKMGGGIFAARIGQMKTILFSLSGAAVCYLLSGSAGFGLAALFLFNMTMPVTLQMLADRFRDLPGTMFGLLTAGLFVGFLPRYYDITFPISDPVAGAVSSVISLVMLVTVVIVQRKGEDT